MKKKPVAVTKKKIVGSELHEHAEAASLLLKAIGNPARLMILCTLFQGEFTVGELNERIDMSQSNLSQHLAVLRREGLVRTRREAQTIFYSLESVEVQTVMACLHKIYCG